jgi:hypothetical protein
VLYFAIPTYNEAETIGVLLWRLRTVMAAQGSEYEVLVYDDASTDATREVLAPYAQVLPLTILGGDVRRGTAAAIDQLAREASRRTRYPRRDAVVFLQGDFTDRPDELPELLKRFDGGADLVAGERVTSTAPLAVQRVRTAERWLVRRLVRIPAVQDYTSPMRVVRLSVIRDALNGRNGRPLAVGERAVAWIDLLLALVPHARRVDLVPVKPDYSLRSRSSRTGGWGDAIALVKYAWANRGGRSTAVQRIDAKVLPTAEPLIEDEDDRPRRAARISDDDGSPTRSRGRRRDRDESKAPTARRLSPPTDAGADPTTSSADAQPRKRRRRRGEGRSRGASEINGAAGDDIGATAREPEEQHAGPSVGAVEGADAPRRKKKRRRKRRSGDSPIAATDPSDAATDSVDASLSGDLIDSADEATDAASDDSESGRRRRPRPRRRRRRSTGSEDGGPLSAGGADEGAPSNDAGAEPAGSGELTAEQRERRRRRRRRRGGGRSRAEGTSDGRNSEVSTSDTAPPDES